MLISDYLAGKVGFPQLRARIVALGEPSTFSDELHDILQEVDGLRGQRPAFELAAMQVCWLACLNVPKNRLRGEVAFLLARSHMAEQQWTESRDRLEEAEQFFRTSGEASRLNLVRATQASLALASDDLDMAIKLYPIVIAEFEAAGDELNAASALLGYGQALATRDERAGARRAYQRAIELFRGGGHNFDEFKSLMLVANSFDAPEDREQQVDYLMQAAAVARHSAVNTNERIRVLARLVPSAARLGRLQPAIDACREGIDLARAASDRMLEGFFEGSLGSILSQRGEGANALKHLERSLTIAHAIDDTEGVRVATHNIAQAKRAPQHNKAPFPEPAKASNRQHSSANRASRTVDELVAVARQWRQTDSRDKGPLARIVQPTSPGDAEAIVAAALDASDAIELGDPRLAALLVLAIEQWLGVPAAPRTMTRLYANLGAYAARGGDMAGAVKCYETAAEIAHANDLKKEFVAIATNLGTMLRRSGRTAEAADTYDAALQTAQDLEPRMRAMVLVNAATAWSDLGRKDRSILLSGEAVEILRNEPDAGEMLSVALINRGGALFSLSQIKEAEADISETLNLARSIGNKAQEGVALGHLGLIRFAQGLAADAIRYLERAAHQAEEAHDLWNAQHWYRDLGNAYIWTGFDAAAEKSFDRALELSQRASDPRSEAIALLGLAISTRSSDRRRESLDRAWELASTTGNASVALQVACQAVQIHGGWAAGVDENMSLERLLTLEGGFKPRNDAALKEAKIWLERGQELSHIVGDEADGQMRNARSIILRLEGRVQEAINMLLDDIDEVTGLARTTREAGVGLLYFTGLKRPDLALPYLEQALIDFDKISQELRADEHRLAMRDETARVVLWTIECALGVGRIERAFEVLERSKTREIRRLRAMDHDDGPSEVPTLAEVSAHLKDSQTAVVCFVLGTQSTRAFIVTADGVLDPIDIAFDAVGIAAKWLHVQTAYEKATSPAAAFDASLTRDWHQSLQDICADLGDCLSVKLVPLLESCGIREVILVPQSMLHSFPLHATILSSGAALVDRFIVSYAPSATAFIAGNARAETEAKAPSFVAFADSLGDLPFSHFEAVAPTSWKHVRTAFCGAEVTRERILSQMAGADWVHIACHARQVLGDNDATGIYLADSGSGDEDRLLSMRLVVREVRLHKRPVVVLSGCETGAVTPRIADEYLSLAGAFLAAGARAVIASLWKVRDSVALLIMRRLYSEVEASCELPQALQSAQLWLRSLSGRDARQQLMQIIPPGSDRDLLLTEFDPANDDELPFADIADWGAFQLVGGASHSSPNVPKRLASKGR